MRRARIGVIGAGWWSTQAHIPSLVGYEKAELVGIADPDPQKLAAAADYYDVSKTHEDYHELLSEVEGVVIAVPHAYHYDVARDALDAGVHVLVEKPMALTAAHAWELVERAQARGVELMVGTTFQFTSLARRVREIVQSGGIGELLYVSGLFASIAESFYRGRPEDYAPVFEYPVSGPLPNSYSDPRIAGGGQGQSQLSHAMGMVFWVTGRRAVGVFAYMEKFDLGVDLVDAVSYRLDNGPIGTMGATGSLRPGQDENQEIRYYGSEGQLRQDLIHGTADVYYNDGSSEVLPPLAEEDIYPKHLPSRTLADLVLGEGQNLAPGSVAAHTVELLEAAYRSAESGMAVRTADLR